MAGYRPANSGNRSAQRFGPAVSRRLRNAGWNISANARKHKAPGVFVSARGDFISVLVDLGLRSKEAAEGIAQTVSEWGCSPEVSDHGDWALIHFTYGR